MNKLPHDINDDEIRIISSGSNDCGSPTPEPTRRRRLPATVRATVWAIIIAACVAGIFFAFAKDTQSPPEEQHVGTPTPAETVAESNPSLRKGHVEISDTAVNGFRLRVYQPVNASPALRIGSDALCDSSVIFAVRAADVRQDNGGIVGAFVVNGELMSKGRPKSGFCAIIGGELTIGVADATPYLEQALENDGYFFRQYPLVVANQVVENKPKGASLRKALAELHGHTVVVMSGDKMTFHDFSQSLADLGVTNAIYLVGSSAYGYAVDSRGNKIEFGRPDSNSPANANYLVWR